MSGDVDDFVGDLDNMILIANEGIADSDTA